MSIEETTMSQNEVVENLMIYTAGLLVLFMEC